jgi:hypothetical protein
VFKISELSAAIDPKLRKPPQFAELRYASSKGGSR